ncbi:MAG TPA: Ppx/GppA phosphatase family protein [Acidimicrobiales bacterium]|nr:Ppx/GppA phosphatase family protein [Acidimicrobiales bacterium]
MGELVAAIDCGTNSTRLLVGDGERTVERLTQVTRLGAGVDRNGHLHAEAIDRTVDVLRAYRDVLAEHGVTRVRATATSAVRDADNGVAFLAAAEAAIGVRPDVLTGDEEGRLTFAGATSRLDPARGPFCVIDIGGGSTEFSIGDGSGTAEVVSVDMGSVRFTERFLPSDPPRPEELVSALSVAEAHLDDVARELPDIGATATWIAVAGTATTMAAVEIGLDPYDPDVIDGFELTRPAAEDVYRTLVTEALVDRVHNPGLHVDRAEVIVGGACLVVAIMRYFGIDPLVISERDLLDGIIAGLVSA